jgi:hypothetical protein
MKTLRFVCGAFSSIDSAVCMKNTMGIKHLLRHMDRTFLARWPRLRAALSTGAKRVVPVSGWEGRLLSRYLAESGLARPERYLKERRLRAPAFFFSPGQRERYAACMARWDRKDGQGTADRALALSAGRFSSTTGLVLDTGFPPDWHKNPLTGEALPKNRHFADIVHLGAGDYRMALDLSRFAFAPLLVRAYWRTGDNRHAETFFTLLDDWRDRNPPMRGLNWMSARETAVRTLALWFALYGFLDAPAARPRRVYALVQLLAVSLERVAAEFHLPGGEEKSALGVEAAALYTGGLLFPEFREAVHWRRLGKKMLTDHLMRFFLPDGSHLSQSLAEHRISLECAAWAMRLGETLGDAFPDTVRERVAKALEFLLKAADPESGKTPCAGQEDGTLALPLSGCGYGDTRPVTAMVHYLLRGTRCHSDGPWDEALLWLFGPEALDAAPEAPARGDIAAPDGGFYSLGDEEGLLFIRCGSHIHKPAHADMLHADLIFRGAPIAVDAGTYSLFQRAPWNNPFIHTACHNTVHVDKKDQMEWRKNGWTPWLNAVVHARMVSPDRVSAYFEGEHDGYRALAEPALHRRAALRVQPGHYLLIDRLASRGEHTYRLHWLFEDYPHTLDTRTGLLALDTPAGKYHAAFAASAAGKRLTSMRADPYTTRGWRSESYMRKSPAISVDLTARDKWATFYTYFSPEPAALIASDEALTFEAGNVSGFLYLRGDFPSERPMVRTLKIQGGAGGGLDFSGFGT